MKNIFYFIFIFLGINVVADNKDLFSVGAKESGMGGCSVADVSLWSISNNQAGLGFLNNIIAGIHYENRFNMSGVGYNTFGFALPTNSGTFGLKINYLGYSSYNNLEAGLVYGKSFGAYFSLGIGLNYLRTYIAHDYGSTGVALAEIGILAKPVNNLSLAAHLYNITRSKYPETNSETIPSIFKFGALYDFSEDVVLTAELDKDINNPMVFRAGIEFKLVKSLFIRTGVSTNTTLLSFGLGYKTTNLSLDFAFSYHNYLGYSPYFSLIYSFNNW